MPRSAFHFEQVALSAIRGFAGQGFTVPGLGPGIIVIHGPNGVGKSTLSLGMNLLLWEQVAAPPGTVLRAQVQVAGATQVRERFQERLTAKAGAQAVAASPWPGPETRDRYTFSLSDLLQANQSNQAFGEHLRQQMQGGVDFPSLRAGVGAMTTFSSSRLGPARDLKEAQDRVRDQAKAQGDQENLEAEVRYLEDEVRQLGAHRQAEQRLEVLDRGLEALEQLLDREEVLAPFLAREALLGRLQDSDGERHDELRAARDEAMTARSTLASQLQKLDGDLARLNLQGTPAKEAALAANHLAAALQEAAKALEAQGSDLAQAQAALDDWQRAHPWLAPDDYAGPEVSRERLQTALTLSRQLEQSHATRHALSELASQMGPEDPVPPVQALAAAAGLLEHWLDQRRRLEGLAVAPGRPRAAALLVAGAVAGLAALAAALKGGAFLLAAATAAALILLGLGALALRPARRGDPGQAQRDLAETQARFLALAVTGLAPAVWDEAHVRNAATALRETLALAGGQAWRNGFRAAVRTRRDHEASRWAELRAEAGELARQLSLPADAAEPFGGFLALMASRLEEGLKLRAALAAAQGRVRHAADTLKARREEAAALLQTFGRDASAEPRAALTALAADLDTALRLLDDRARVAADLANARQDSPQERLDGFLSQRSLQEDTFPEAWAARARWQPLRDAHAAQRTLVESLLAREPQWTGELQALADRDGAPLPQRREALRQRHAGLSAELLECRRLLAAVGARQEDLGRKKLALETLTRGGTLAVLILERDLAAQRLEAVRQKEVEGRALTLLIDRLEKRSAEEDLPPQLRRASELFQAFTRHRYTLQFLGGAFHAREGGQTLSLQELSEGTRLQLLMAVRLAYVEHQEEPEGIQLPLFLDEVLANCDDERALAIIDAIRIMAGSGRQIFYFTAQQDEVEKWRTLGGEAVQVVDLATVRSLEAQRRIPLPLRDWARPAVPEPGAALLLDYARTLGAPGAALWVPLHQQHPWLACVEGDQGLLCDFLRGGLTTLGQVQRFLQDQDGDVPRRLLTTLTLLEAAQTALQAARPRPLDPALLEQAEIKGLLADRTNLLAALAEAGGDPRRLLDATIPGVGGKRKESLKEWLLREGHVVEQETPSVELLLDLKVRYASLLAPEAEGWISVERFVLQAG
jgi:uncharacterized protein YhaN